MSTRKYEDMIIKEIKNLSGQYSEYEIFTDWIKMSSLAISNQTDFYVTDLWTKRENEYIAIAKKYGEKVVNKLSDMTGMLALALEENMSDVLGSIYMRAGMGSKAAGQFFTPFHLSELTARLQTFKQGEKYILHEPSCGGVGMIIAAAQIMHEQGINYQRAMEVVAQDLDWKGVYMTYFQLSLLGVKAKVIQGDTLQNTVPDPSQALYTPAWKGMLI